MIFVWRRCRNGRTGGRAACPDRAAFCQVRAPRAWVDVRAGVALGGGAEELLDAVGAGRDATTDGNPDLIRDDLQNYVIAQLGDPADVLVIDETGFWEKGTRSAGVSRQNSGTAGRIENCQIGVFLTYATPAGRTFLERELYLPSVLTDDRDRCAAAGTGADIDFATKLEQAMMMLSGP